MAPHITLASKWGKTNLKAFVQDSLPTSIKSNLNYAFAELNAYTGLEISKTTTSLDADIKARAYLFTGASQKQTVAFASYPPIGALNYNTRYLNGEGSSRFTTLHELGHVLGLRHTHDALAELAPWPDNFKYSVMSYLGRRGGVQGYSVLDIEALRDAYGTQLANTGNNTYELFKSAGRTIVDDGGNDTLVLKGVSMGYAYTLLNRLEARPAGEHIVLDLPGQRWVGILGTTELERVIMPNGSTIVLGEGPEREPHVEFASKWAKPSLRAYFQPDVPGQIKQNMLNAFAEINEFTNLNISEVGTGIGEDIEVRVQDLRHASWVASASYPPFGKISYNKRHINSQGLLPMIAVHELGHALGLRHTHDNPKLLGPWSDNYKNSVMSYKGNRRGPNGFSVLDIEALRDAYGTNLHNTGNNTYKLSDFVGKTIVDDGGFDRLIIDHKEADSIAKQLQAKPIDDHVVLEFGKNQWAGILDTTHIEQIVLPGGEPIALFDGSADLAQLQNHAQL